MNNPLSFRSVWRNHLRRAAWVAIVGTMLVAVAGAAPAWAEQITGKRVALVIGNSKYRYVTTLPNPGNDARLVARTLRAEGFTLIGGDAQIDLDKTRFDDLVGKFGQSIANADVALFYYSGHGLQVRGVNYLVPVSANPTGERDLDFQMTSADIVLHQMAEAKTKLNIVILDACRNNPFGGRGLRATGGGLAEMHAPEGTLISYATQPGNVASDGDGHDSPFTLALTNAMRQPGMDLLRLFNQVGLDVKRNTKGDQQPWLASSPIEGDFFFAPTQGAANGMLQAPKPVLVPLPAEAPAPAPAATADESAPAERSTGEVTLASNEAPKPAAASDETVIAQMRPIERGFHCPRAGMITMEDGRRREWNGPDYDNPHVCASRVDGVVEHKLFQFYDMNASGVLLIDDALAPFFNGANDDITVRVGPISYEWSRAGREAVMLGDKSFDTEKFIVDVDASSSLYQHRGRWTLWYNAKTGLFLKSDYRAYVGSTSSEQPAWQVSAIMLKGHDMPVSKSAEPAAPPAPVRVAAAVPAAPPPAAPPQAVQPASASVASRGGFHCPARDTLASVSGRIVVWQAPNPANPHMCASNTEGHLQYRLFNFYTVAGNEARMVDDELSGFFLGTASDATVIVNGQRYTWHHAGTDRVINHGQPVEVSVLKVDTQEDGSSGGGRHRGTWTILYDAKDGLLLKGTYSRTSGDRGLEPENWETATFNAAS